VPLPELAENHDVGKMPANDPDLATKNGASERSRTSDKRFTKLYASISR